MGKCFYLFSKQKFGELQDYPTPEVKKIKTENLIPAGKVFRPHEDPESFLADLIEPPNEMAIEIGKINMENAGMMMSNCLTPLGLRVVHMSLSPNIVKTLIYSNILRYNTDTFTFGTSCESKADGRTSKSRETGRTKRGECYFLFTQDKYELLNEFPDPEIKKMRTEKLNLDSKICSPMEESWCFLADLITPPETAVNTAINKLTEDGLIYRSSLTPLGLRVAYLPLSTKIVKSLIYVFILRQRTNTYAERWKA